MLGAPPKSNWDCKWQGVLNELGNALKNGPKSVKSVQLNNEIAYAIVNAQNDAVKGKIEVDLYAALEGASKILFLGALKTA